MAVNELHFIVDLANDCEWGNWVDGKCSEECGNGTRISTRAKNITEVTGGVCNGSPTRITHCLNDKCPGK